MEKALAPVSAPWEMHWIEGAGHSLDRTKDLELIRDRTRAWLTR